MTDESGERGGLGGLVRRAVGGARDAVDDTLEATVSRVGQSVGGAARDVTSATAQQVIEDLEPYLIEEAVPRIVEGITPYLVSEIVPQVLAGVHANLVEETVPSVVDGVTDHLVAVTVPRVVEGITPTLVEGLLPRLLADLTPYLSEELVPEVVAGLTPLLERELAPQLVDALMPKIEAEVAPQLVRALLPMIRREVVPTILDDIVDDPRVRDLIREQSQGLFLDALEALRENLADADDLIEGLVRRLVRRPVRPVDQSALALVLDDASGAGRLDPTWAVLTQRRRLWQAQPAPPAPPGREHAYAGAVTRLLALVIDLSLVGWLVGQGLAAVLSLIDSAFPSAPAWINWLLSMVAASFVPVYLTLCWWLTGRSLGSFLMGTRVCTPDGRRPGFVRATVRAWAGVTGLVVWLAVGVLSAFDPKRRTLLDRLVHTEVRYVVPDEQQRRYLREALAARAPAPVADDGAAGSAPEPPTDSARGAAGPEDA